MRPSAIRKHFFRPLLAMAIFAVLVSITACNPIKQYVYFQDKSDAKNERPDSGSFTTVPYTFKVRKGDVIFLKVVSFSQGLNQLNSDDQNQNANSPYERGLTVDEDGNLNVPLAGKVPAFGKTMTELHKVLSDSLNQYLSNYTLIVKILSYKVSVFGEVIHPGVIPVYGESITLPEALSVSQDMTIYGNRRQVKVLRQSNIPGKIDMFVVDMTDQNVINSPAYYLHPDDVVYVEPTKNRFGFFRNAPVTYLVTGLSAVGVILSFVVRQKN